MKALLDTHALLWWGLDSSRLSPAARAFVTTPDNGLYLSVASCWELVIKIQLGKLRLPEHPTPFLRSILDKHGIELLAIEFSHVTELNELPSIHRDPFDRLLIAQSRVERMPVLTADPVFAQYGAEVIW